MRADLEIVDFMNHRILDHWHLTSLDGAAAAAASAGGKYNKEVGCSATYGKKSFSAIHCWL